MYLNFFKRPLDILFSLLAIALLSWLFILIVLAYIVTFEFPVFFTQKRTGKSNRPFIIYKLRTLRNGGERERRFWMGDLLRFLSLDELPQLWNVLKGEMSLVGPRPLPVEYLSLYSDKQKRRHNVRPGITGWAQVNGRHSIPWNEKFELDLYYVDTISLRLDVIIVLKTMATLLSFRKDLSLTEEKFRGA